MTYNRNQRTARPQVAIEVCDSELRLISTRRDLKADTEQVVWHKMRWRHDSRNLLTAAGASELQTAIKQLVTQQRLAGHAVTFTLSGAYCVTRVVAGTTEHVRRELAALEERSQRYLSLGPGEKALAGSIQQIDARHQHALLAVANQRTLDALVEAAEHAGLTINRIEPSLVALSRLLGHLGADAKQPVMVLNVDQSVVELGISYQGRLLLDYRPGGRDVHDEISSIIARHLPRLRRYCARYFRFAQGELNHVVLCGIPELIDKLQQGFDGAVDLAVDVLDLTKLKEQWRFSGNVPDSDVSAAAGSILTAEADGSEIAGPNLIDEAITHAQRPGFKQTAALLWPIAAALVIAAGLFIAKERVRWRCESLQQSLAAFEPAEARYRGMRLRLEDTENKLQCLGKISQQLRTPALDQILLLVAGCLPNDVWLDRFEIESNGAVRASGISSTAEGVYELCSWLEKAPPLEDVNLVSTSANRFDGRAVTKYQIQFKIADYGAITSEAKQDD